MIRLAALLALLAAVPAAAEQDAITLESTIVHFATEAGEHVGGYVRIRNAADVADRLVEVRCACSRLTEIHSTARPGTMETLPTLDIPAGGTVEIRPGSGLHLMLEAVGPIPVGSEVEVTLRFEHAGTLTQRFAVVADTGAAWQRAEVH